MSGEQNLGSPRQASNWVARPYAERRILAGFLNRGEEAVVYPYSSEWSAEVAERVAAIQGKGNTLPPSPNAGVCDIANVEEPEALKVIDRWARSIGAPLFATFSYCWVSLENLIAAAAVMDPLPSAEAIDQDDPRSLGDYSLYVNVDPLIPAGQATFATNGPISAALVQAVITDSHLVVSYKLSKVPRPIIVGYEEGRCYLLTEYGRVIAALAAGVKRLLCLMYFGLDLTQRDMAIRGLDATGLVAKGDPLNHFGRTRLTSERPPLVQDFLNEDLTVRMPSRGTVFIFEPSVQIVGYELAGRPNDGIPLKGSVGEHSVRGTVQQPQAALPNELVEINQP